LPRYNVHAARWRRVPQATSYHIDWGPRQSAAASAIESRSEQAELAQLAAQAFRHVPEAGRGAIEIARRVLRLEIAPALERPERSRLDQHELGLEHQVAAADPLLVDERAYVQEPLSAQDLAANDPIERAAVGELLGALGHHPGAVHVLAREAALLAIL